jgi:hypothetical protein
MRIPEAHRGPEDVMHRVGATRGHLLFPCILQAEQGRRRGPVPNDLVINSCEFLAIPGPVAAPRGGHRADHARRAKEQQG